MYLCKTYTNYEAFITNIKKHKPRLTFKVNITFNQYIKKNKERSTHILFFNVQWNFKVIF